MLRLVNYRDCSRGLHTHTHSNTVGMIVRHLIMAELCLNCAALRMCEVSKQQCIAAEKLDLKWWDEEKREASVGHSCGPSIEGANFSQLALRVFSYMLFIPSNSAVSFTGGKNIRKLSLYYLSSFC